jgi:hypothetical protein
MDFEIDSSFYSSYFIINKRLTQYFKILNGTAEVHGYKKTDFLEFST